jgi:hypothetical protein
MKPTQLQGSERDHVVKCLVDLLAGNDQGLYRTSATTIKNLLPILNLDSVNRCLGAIEGATARVESKETADILNSTQKALIRRKFELR